MEHKGGHGWEVTKPTPIQVGRAQTPPPSLAIEAIQEAILRSGATEVYWFWVSIDGDAPHLGLAVSPAEDAVVSAIGQAIETVWKRYSPQNPVFDILRFGDPDLDTLIREVGEPLLSIPGHAEKGATTDGGT